MKKLIYIINFITIRLFNKAFFSIFNIDYKQEKSKKFTTHIIKYCGYYKNYNKNDWRFSENNQRKNIKYIKLSFEKFI